MSGFEDDWPFCECGVTLLDGEDECSVCAASPHGRECDCHECADYWHEVAERSHKAADEANRQLVCSCGWTGAYAEHHRDRRPDCDVRYRDPARAAFWRERGWPAKAVGE